MYGIAPDLIDDDLRKGGHHQFTRSFLLARTSTVWEALQDGASWISRIKRAAFSGVFSKR